MSEWATILTVVFAGITTFIVILGFIKSFRLATKDDIKELREDIRNINHRIDAHLESHASNQD